MVFGAAQIYSNTPKKEKPFHFGQKGFPHYLPK